MICVDFFQTVLMSKEKDFLMKAVLYKTCSSSSRNQGNSGLLSIRRSPQRRNLSELRRLCEVDGRCKLLLLFCYFNTFESSLMSKNAWRRLGGRREEKRCKRSTIQRCRRKRIDAALLFLIYKNKCPTTFCRMQCSPFGKTLQQRCHRLR